MLTVAATTQPDIFLPATLCNFRHYSLAEHSLQVQENTFRYDNRCEENDPMCMVTFTIPDTMNAPVYFYYQLDNFYQNHRRYVRSRSDRQLRGDEIDSPGDVSEDCDPQVFRDDAEDEDLADVLFPCGLIANSRFSDTFTDLRDSDNEEIVMNRTGIAWASDVRNKFRESPNCEEGGVGFCPDPSVFTNEDFIVWMRTAALPKFKKLYGRIEDRDLEPGDYTITVNNQFDVSGFDGRKFIVFSTTSWLGGKNNFLGGTYLVVGFLCTTLGLIFLAKNIMSPRRPGDTRYLQWSN